MHSTTLRSAMLAAATFAIAACGSDDQSPVDSAVPAESRLVVVLSSQLDTVPEATSTTLIARVTDVSGILKSAAVTWISTDPAVVSVASGLVTGVAPGAANVIASTGAVSDTARIVVTPNELSLDVQPSAAAVVLGDTLQFVATVRSRSGDIISVNRFTWSSSDPIAAAIIGAGAVHTKHEGDVTITAEALARRGSSDVKVFKSPITSVSIEPTTANVYAGATLQLAAIPRDARGREVIGADVSWGSSNYLTAAVDQHGLVTGKATGSVVITATVGNRTASATINVLSPPAKTLDISVPSDTVLLGLDMQATATPRDENGQPLSGRTIAWQSANPAVATVTSTGVIHGVAVGGTNISAIADGLVATRRVEVAARVASSISVNPTAPSVLVGQTAQLSARILDQQGTEITGLPVSWKSSNQAVASVTGTGLISGQATGSSTISATSGSLSASAIAAVGSVAVASVEVSPSSATLIVGGTVVLSATAYAADLSPIPGRTPSWSSSNPSVATVSAAGFVRAVAVGAATVQATIEGKVATAAITVDAPPPAPVARVTVSLASSALEVGQTTQASAVLKDAAGNVLTGRTITWSSLDQGVATVSASGLVTAQGGGTVAIIASSESVSGAASLTVDVPDPAPVASVEIDLPTSDLLVGQSIQAVVTLKDAQGQVLTGRTITFTTDNPMVVSISSSGVVTGIGEGSTQIRVASGGVTSAASLSVTAPSDPTQTIESILVGAPTSDLSVGQTTQANAVAKDSSGDTMAATFTWTTSNPGVATVSTTGLVTAIGAGSATISASASGKTGSMMMSVTVPSGFTINLTSTRDTIWERPASGSDGTHFTMLRARVYDGSGVEVPDDLVTWRTSDSTAALYSLWNRGGYREYEVGDPVRDTTLTITASYQGQSKTRTVVLRMRSTQLAPVASVALTVNPTNIPSGALAQAAAIVKDASGNVLTGRTITYSSSNASVATVSPLGVVAALAAGTAIVTATSEGMSDSEALSVGASSQVASVIVSLSPSTLSIGQTGSVGVTLADAQGNVLTGRTVTYQSSNPAVATVSPTGQTIGLTTGTTVVTATSEGVSGARTLTVQSTWTGFPVVELPRSRPVIPPGLESLSCTINVAPGQLQSALNAARGGAVLCLTGTHGGSFTVPARSDAGWVVIRSAGTIPSGRMRPSLAGPLAKIVSQGTAGMSALRFAARSVRTLVLGVEITSLSTLTDGPTALVEVSLGQETSVADLPTDIAFQQVYIHGWPTQKIRRAFALNGGAQTVRDSWCSEIHAVGFDSQCAISWNGSGPILIENNTLEAASENLMLGGAPTKVPGMVTSDVTIRRNHIRKPPTWKGQNWNVKNLIETKSSARVLVEENVLEGSWLQGQTGYAFVLKSSNAGGCTWCSSSDWTIRRNLIRNVGSGFTLGGRADGTVTDSTNRRMLIEDNWVEPINIAPYVGEGRPFMFTDGNNDIVIRGNVFEGGAATVAAIFNGSGSVSNLEMSNNVLPRGQYGLFTGGSSEGLPSWLAGPSGTRTWNKNAMIGSSQATYPTGTSWHSSLSMALGTAGVARSTVDAGVAGVVVPP
ncbi:MAG TPA: Ig-like domain-containing protein [Gemmatimonadaceae bacterium]